MLTTSLLQRALAYTKAYRGVDLWRLVADAKLARLEAWMKAAMERPSGRAEEQDVAGREGGARAVSRGQYCLNGQVAGRQLG